MSTNKLEVYLNTKFIGILENDKDGGLTFEYDKNNDAAISLSLPLEKRIFSNSECKGFFNGLLPENFEIRKKIGEKYGINSNNDFAILKVIGYDCPGALSFIPPIQENNLQEYYHSIGEKLNEEKLEKYIKDLPQKPLGIGAKDLRLSLAGAQTKTAVLYTDGEIYIPTGLTPTTHILKPAIKGLKETVENEYICLKTAEKFGLKVPNVEIKQVGKIKYFLIERYDRKFKSNKIKRLHQEDFCQALNIPSAYKYEADGGLGYKACFNLLKKTSKPGINMKLFIKQIIFNYLILNNDAHGKNFSLIYRDNGEIELAPVYDILCTCAYSKLSNRMAMQIGNKYDCQGIMPEDFKIFANEVGISYPEFKKEIISCCQLLPILLEEVVNGFENKIGKHLINLVKKNCYKNLKRFEK